MSVHDRVVKVVSIWGHCSTAPNDDDQLQVIWAVSHKAVPFQPDAAQQLIIDLQTEFRTSPTERIDLIASDFDPGNIKTVDQLATAIGQMAGALAAP